MSESNLQLLLHAGELQYIIETIKASKQSGCVGGCLFGLWRNSLKQPVIQFVTGSGSDKNDIREIFENRNTKEYAKILEQNHRLLHLGFWFYGNEQDQNTAKRIAFNEHNKKNVLLLIDFKKDGNSTEQLSGEYHLRIGDLKASSSLYQEDVLEGHSSFRLFAPLTEKILKSKVSPKPSHAHVENYSKNLKSRVQVEEAVTSEEQWYSTDEGMTHLQLLFQYFQQAGITPDMSRDTATQDMQFGLGTSGYILDFPANFPKRMPEIRSPDGSRYELKINHGPGDDVCATLVHTVASILQERQSRRSGHGGGRYR